MNRKVLLVDDDVNILAAYRRVLRGKLELSVAESGKEALTILKRSDPFAVIVSDYRMPEMDGIEILARARELCPDTVRIMLTGQADMQAAIDAINQGNIFRFLTKPLPVRDIPEAGLCRYGAVPFNSCGTGIAGPDPEGKYQSAGGYPGPGQSHGIQSTGPYSQPGQKSGYTIGGKGYMEGGAGSLTFANWMCYCTATNPAAGISSRGPNSPGDGSILQSPSNWM